MTAEIDGDPSLGSAIFARLHPASYLSRFLTSSVRPDGRSLDSFRSSSLAKSSIQTAEGSCIVRQGSTVFVAGVKAELLDLSEEDDNNDAGESEVSEQDKQYGLGPVDRKRIVVGVELSPMASAKFKPGPPGEESQILTSRLMSILESCPPLNRSSLLIEGSSASWCLYIDLVCLSYDGNALDAALLAIHGALEDTRLPLAIYDEEVERVICSPDRSESQKLKLISCPLSFSFAIVDETYLLSDLDAFESSLASSSITVTLDANAAKKDDLVDVQCLGGCSAVVPLQEANQASVEGTEATGGQVRVSDEDLVAICILRARKRCAELKALLTSGHTLSS